MEEDVPLPAPMDIQIQQNAAPRPAAQQKQMKGATQSWIPLTRIYPAQFDDAVPEPDTPPEAEAPRAKQHAAHKSAAGPKRKHEGLNEGKGTSSIHLSHQMLLAACPSGLDGCPSGPALFLRGVLRCAELCCALLLHRRHVGLC